MLEITHHSGAKVSINYERVDAIEDENGHGKVIMASGLSYLAMETREELAAAMDDWYATPGSAAPKLITGPTEGKSKK